MALPTTPTLNPPFVTPPNDLVALGHVVDPYGVRGELKIYPYSQQDSLLLHVKTWWINRIPANAPSLVDVDLYSVLRVKTHADVLIAEVDGITDRDRALALKGCLVFLSRSDFPVLPQNEFYWHDLIGLSVENLQGDYLGKIQQLIDSPAHPILQVMDDRVVRREYLIPFIDHFVPTVDWEQKKVIVDWGRDY